MFWRPKCGDQDFNEEIEAHLQIEADRLVEEGMDRDEALAAARRAFGNVTRTRERFYESSRWMWLENLSRDLRYALRGFRNHKSLAAAAILSLALGIGANTAIFTLTDQVLLRSLPVDDPDRLYQIRPSEFNSLNYPLFERMRDAAGDHGSIFAVTRPMRLEVSFERLGDSVARERVSGSLVSGDYFTVLGVGPFVGRVLSSDDNRSPGAHAVAVLSHRFWTRRFNRDPSVVGETFALRGTLYTVIGVSEPGFFGVRPGFPPDLWIPIVMKQQVSGGNDQLTRRKSWWFQALARLKSGVEPAQLEAILQQQFHVFNEEQVEGVTDLSVRRRILAATLLFEPAGGGLDELRRRFSHPLLLLSALAGFVLLIACANVANLLLVRAQARSREVTVRLALGAGRARLIGQLLTESVLLAVVGGAAGVALAYLGAEALVQMVSTGRQPVVLDVSPDWRVLGFTLTVSMLCGILFGIAPAWNSARTHLQQSLRARPQALGGGSRFGVKHALAMLQIALSLVLLVGAGLFTTSLSKIYDNEMGFDPENVLIVHTNPRSSGYYGSNRGESEPLAGRRNALHFRLLNELEALPEVRSVSLSHVGLMGAIRQGGCCLRRTDETIDSSREDRKFFNDRVSPGFFETVGIPLLAGRDFTIHDNESAPRVLILNRTAAQRLFPQAASVGRLVQYGKLPTTHYEVVGVVEDAKSNSLLDETKPYLYFPLLQTSELGWRLLAKTTLPPDAAAQQVRHAIARIAPDLVIPHITTVERNITDTLTQQRLLARLTTLFGALALLLAAIGLYGLMSFLVRRRTAEIGLRMALGAREGQIAQMVLRQAMLIVGFGVALGLAVVLALAPLLESFLYDLEPRDPATIAGAAAVLIAVAAATAWIPARRAASLRPTEALRYE